MLLNYNSFLKETANELLVMRKKLNERYNEAYKLTKEDYEIDLNDVCSRYGIIIQSINELFIMLSEKQMEEKNRS